MSSTEGASRPYSVFFGHQSVGADIIRGLSELPDIERRIGPRICDRHHIETDRPAADAAWLLIHACVGRNREPLSKLDEFERLVREEFAANVDVALLKFCYIDITAATQVPELFQSYITRMAALADAVPHIRIAHVTVPLRRVQPGWRAALGRALGRADPEVAHNRAREDFNGRLREAVSPASLFDLAAIESQRQENGSSDTSPRSLRADWTNDGGHLNARGRKLAARAFLQYLESQRPPVCPQR
jgi:lysophospholipase L1-like esterase